MRVAVERPLGVTVLGLIAGEVPDDQGLVAGGRQEHVGASFTGERMFSRLGGRIRRGFVLLHRGGQAGDPAIL